ncbi:sigma-70 family RNA polymerase sigma factor [bacterium]|nr:sigma-70 family RNA polymerase sigma factor [bacterium]
MNKPAAIPSKLTDLQTADDAALVDACRSGSEAAFRELVERYRERVYRIAYRIVGNEAEAEDVAQETFVKAHRGLGGFAGRSSLFTWLYRITRNVALDHVRKARGGRLVSLDARAEEDDRALSEVLPDAAPSPTQTAADAEMLLRVRQALEELSEKHRTVLELREFEGMSYQEIAETVGCNVGTVMSRLFYARNQLARRLRPLLEEPGRDGTRSP